MVRILVTNDDGVHSEGIRALADALMHLGDVTIVAPIQEASAIGHALTLRRPLRIDTIGPKIFAVDGTPTESGFFSPQLTFTDSANRNVSFANNFSIFGAGWAKGSVFFDQQWEYLDLPRFWQALLSIGLFVFGEFRHWSVLANLLTPVFAVTMFVGRLGPLVLVLLLAERRQRVAYRPGVESIRIG